jgi:hypothetical protein
MTQLDSARAGSDEIIATSPSTAAISLRLHGLHGRFMREV